MIDNYKDFIETYFKIQTKNGELVTFKFNEAQKRFYEIIKSDFGKKEPRYIVLKARQLGISTLSEAMITALTIVNKHSNGVVIAHTNEATSHIYNMTKRFIDNLPAPLVPQQKYSNKKEIVFDGDGGNDSSIRVMATGEVRSGTYRYAHLSEYGFWRKPEETMTALMQSIPQDNESLVIIESTANGYNHFYDLWNKAVNNENDFTPIFFPWFIEPQYVRPYHNEELSKEELDLKDLHHLTNEQIMWRRWCIANNCEGDINRFKQEYPSSPEEAFLTSGDTYFDVENIQSRLRTIKEPIKQGYFDYDYDGLSIKNIRWVNDSKGYIKIYEDFKGPTGIGADTSGEGSDYFVAQVLTKEGKQIATLRHQFDEDLFVKQLYCLASYFKAIIAVETNFSTYPSQELKRLKYPKIYVRKTYDNIRDNYIESYGFKTTSLTRPYILAQLKEIIREHIELINDKDTLLEALTFVNINSKPQAEIGAHDDCIMALAIAYECVKQISERKVRTSKEDEFYRLGF